MKNPFYVDSGNAVESVLRAEMVTVLCRQAPPVFWGNYVVSGLVALLLWRYADKSLLLVWLGAIFIITTLRLILTRRYMRRIPPARAARRWGWGFTLLAGISGVAWGALSLLFLSPAEPVVIVLIGFVLAGMAGGSVASLSAFLPAYYAYVIPTVAPFAVRAFLIGGELFNVLGVLALCLLAVNLYYSKVFWQTLVTSVRLRFENLGLIEQLQQEKARAEAASHAKTRFLAAASHDLRQPVHALGLFAESLQLLAQQARPDPGILGQIADRIQASLRGMGQLLNGLLDVSRLESGVVEAKLGLLKAQEMLDEAAQAFGPLAQNHGLFLRVVPCSLWVNADRALLSRILSNLLANAVRYTRRGGIVLGCRRRGGQVLFQVWDTGVGIPESGLPHIFEEFYQVDNAARHQEQGLGLGLSIVRRCAGLMGAEVSVRSVIGRGTVFSVALGRAEREIKAAMPKAVQPPMRPLRVLLVDDQQPVLDAASLLMTAWGHEVLAARNLEEALNLSGASSRPVDWILADYRLEGGKTGADVIRAIQAKLPREVPAAIITGDTSPQRIQEAARSGYPILHKPLQPEILRQLLECNAG